MLVFKIFNWWLSKKSTLVASNLIKHISQKKGISLLMSAYNEMGILKYQNEDTGENFLINVFLKDKLQIIPNPILFDVGANIGHYTNLMYMTFPNAEIHAFEPISRSYKILKGNFCQDNIKLVNTGLGIETCKTQIFHYDDGYSNEHASLFPEVISTLHKQNKLVTEEINIDTIDNYCIKNNISRIDFLKIDTEGNELNVLKGAQRMISSKSINIIQFEFNEMNVISRVFLRDFYNILENYEFFRLNTKSLIPLGNYISRNEIFQFQNIVAIKNN